MDGSGRTTWKNWAGNVERSVAGIVAPTTEAEVVDVVTRARDAETRIKAIGTAHSFSDIATTDGIVVSTDALNRVLEIDLARRRVKVQAGIKLWDINDKLAAAGLAMRNLGDVAYQSVAGAVSTSTHGTGKQFGGVSSSVVGLRMVTASGEVVEITEADPDLLDAARVSLGALGLVTEVTLQCVPEFELHAVEQPVLVDDLIAAWPEALEANDHIEFWWLPGSDWALVRANQRGAERPHWMPPQPRIEMSNWALRVLPLMGRWRPTDGGVSVPLRYHDRSDRVFASERDAALEMEYSVPAAEGMACLSHVRETLAAHPEWRIGYPVEVRYVKGDSAWMSTSHGRDSVYVAVHENPARDVDPYFASVEPFLLGTEGRPHWGKLHNTTATTLRGRYPRWDDFTSLRDELDPQRVFGSDALTRVLGP